MSNDFKIHALLATYNDHTALPFALDSVKDVVDSIIVADGAYQKYYDNYLQYQRYFKYKVEPWSTDGTLEMLDILQRDLPPIKVIKTPKGKPWLNQVVKRTALLDAVPSKDWFLILDSDEMFYGDVKGAVNEIMSSGCIAGCVPLYNLGLDVSGFIPFWHPRIFLKLPGMHYARKHWFLSDYAERVIEHTYPLWYSNRCVMAHFKLFKDHRRSAPHMSYMLDMGKSGYQEPHAKLFKAEPEEAEEVIA
jgi:hypothetical protein